MSFACCKNLIASLLIYLNHFAIYGKTISKSDEKRDVGLRDAFGQSIQYIHDATQTHMYNIHTLRSSDTYFHVCMSVELICIRYCVYMITVRSRFYRKRVNAVITPNDHEARHTHIHTSTHVHTNTPTRPFHALTHTQHIPNDDRFSLSFVVVVVVGALSFYVLSRNSSISDLR